MQNARTRAPSATSRSTRWLPMNPSAPVTRTGTPARLRSATAACPDELLALPHVDPVVLDLERPDRPTGVERRCDHVGHRGWRGAPAPRDDRWIERVDPGVDLAFDVRLLVEPDEPI